MASANLLPITDLFVTHSSDCPDKGFKLACVIGQGLPKQSYLWVKQGQFGAITRLRVDWGGIDTSDFTYGNIEVQLNPGNGLKSYLAFSSCSDNGESPIVDISLTENIGEANSAGYNVVPREILRTADLKVWLIYRTAAELQRDHEVAMFLPAFDAPSPAKPKSQGSKSPSKNAARSPRHVNSPSPRNANHESPRHVVEDFGNFVPLVDVEKKQPPARARAKFKKGNENTDKKIEAESEKYDDWMILLAEHFGLEPGEDLDKSVIKEMLTVAATKDSMVWIAFAAERSSQFAFIKALVLLTFRFQVKNSYISDSNRRTLLWLVDLYGGKLPDDIQMKRIPFPITVTEGIIQVDLLRYHLEIMTETLSYLPSLVRCGMLVLMSSQEAINTLKALEFGDFILRVSNGNPSCLAISHVTDVNCVLEPNDGSVESYCKEIHGVQFTFYKWEVSTLIDYLDKLGDKKGLAITTNPLSEKSFAELTPNYAVSVQNEYEQIMLELQEAYQVNLHLAHIDGW
eukprot:TRINITY_DN15487_c0_g1_i1.p1 TRINITY_DN15487_c0_g1~~TRINITY_DN15487_c0_g1_i1.p1  ORF type:complete len:527 (+),score=115.10 TRINITY_DN15487_c0_g1_i1:41-1582(+)